MPIPSCRADVQAHVRQFGSALDLAKPCMYDKLSKDAGQAFLKRLKPQSPTETKNKGTTKTERPTRQ